MDFLNLFTPKAVAANYTEAASNKIPYFGASLFPAKKKAGLDLAWFHGAGGLPVSLAPTAFDAKATLKVAEEDLTELQETLTDLQTEVDLLNTEVEDTL